MGNGFTSIENAILTVLALIVIAIFCGSIYAFIRSIFLFIFSQGEAENKKKARNRIRFMIIGIILTVLLLFFFPLLFKYMGVQGYESFTASNIFARVSEIFSGLLSVREDLSEINSGNVFIEETTPRERPTIDPADYEL